TGDLFDSLLVFENYPVSKVITSRSWSLDVRGVQMHEQDNYPFSITIGVGNTINILFHYNSRLLDEVFVKKIRGHFEQVLRQLSGEISSHQKIKELELLTVSEYYQLTEEFNNTRSDYPLDRTVLDLFKEQVQRRADTVALIFGDESLTYRELDTRSNQLANYLKKKGAGPEVLVAICIERSLNMVIGILGILKSGGAYVPIDPSYPAARIRYMLEDTGAEVFVSSSACRHKMPTDYSAHPVDLDMDWPDISKEPDQCLQYSARKRDLAYVIYTSGSTGHPKGVMIEQGSLYNMTMSWRFRYELEKYPPVLLSLASMSFDVFTGDLCRALLNGGTMVLVPEDKRLDITYLYEEIGNRKVSMLDATPALIMPLIRYSEIQTVPHHSLTLLIVGSDQFMVKDYEHVFAYCRSRKIRLINSYGLTETTIDSSGFEGQAEGLDIVPIGKPLANTTLYIVNGSGQINPIGVEGELYVKGAGLARGYLNRPELTAERFTADPFSNAGKISGKVSGSMPDVDSRIYQTGDLCKWLPDGNISFISRKDEQVKIRGYRIELGEIEHKLQQHAFVNQAVVTVRTDKSGDKLLVAYVVTNETFDSRTLADYLKNELPEYMVPSLFVQLDQLPLTGNGKIDRKGLPDPDVSSQIYNNYMAPVTEIELKLAEIWKDLLSLERVGIHDNFFELGGHSLLATRVISAIKKDFLLSLPIRILFEFNTINDLGKYLELELLAKSAKEEDLTMFEVVDL
ncbi:non-ribosomal peptide synthetase, partial [Flavitalea flava]